MLCTIWRKGLKSHTNKIEILSSNCRNWFFKIFKIYLLFYNMNSRLVLKDHLSHFLRQNCVLYCLWGKIRVDGYCCWEHLLSYIFYIKNFRYCMYLNSSVVTSSQSVLQTFKLGSYRQCMLKWSVIEHNVFYKKVRGNTILSVKFFKSNYLQTYDNCWILRICLVYYWYNNIG